MIHKAEDSAVAVLRHPTRRRGAPIRPDRPAGELQLWVREGPRQDRKPVRGQPLVVVEECDNVCIRVRDPKVQRVRLPLLRFKQVLNVSTGVRRPGSVHGCPGVVGRVVVHHQEPGRAIGRSGRKAFNSRSEQPCPVIRRKHHVNMHDTVLTS